MNIFSYSFVIYGLTVVISLLVVGMIVAVNKIISNSEKGEEGND